MRANIEVKIAILLMDIEAALRNVGYWDDEPPPESSLLSQQPFCIDTLEFNQWLQWVFIPRMQQALQENMTLPQNCSISPMAEEWLKSQTIFAGDLIKVLKEIDELLTVSQR